MFPQARHQTKKQFSLRHHLSTYLWVLKMGSDLCLKTITVSVYEFMYILSVHALASYVQIGKIITISMVVLIIPCGQNYVSLALHVSLIFFPLRIHV